MKIINVSKELFNKSGNNIFYHYTSTDALISIISNSKLRFTNCLFLNDMEEYNYILDLINCEYAKRDDDKSLLVYELTKNLFDYYFNYDKYKNVNEIIAYYMISFQNERKFHIEKGGYYVLSGSLKQDLLPLWVYYSKNDRYDGYSIKMNVSSIASSFKNLEGEFLYGRIIYDKQEQLKIIDDFVEELFLKYDIKNLDDQQSDDLQNEFFDYIQLIRLFFKRDGFSNEREFRVAINTNGTKNEKNKNLGFNHSNGVIKPYIEYYFEDGLPIEEIMLSPSIEEKLGKEGVRTLLNYYNRTKYKDVNINKSSLQLRF